jgi:hypothetical protein
MIHKKLSDVQAKTTEMEKRAVKDALSTHNLKDETKKLKERVSSLESIEMEFLNWKKREPEVRHYLKSFAAIAR